MSIRQNLQAPLRLAAALFNTPTKRTIAWGSALAIAVLAYTLLNPTPTAKPPVPEPIVQGEQLRFPAGHPQIALLGTVAAKPAKNITIELPARLI